MRHPNAHWTAGLILSVLAGCVGVDPRPDYARAGRQITDSTGVAVAFDPSDTAAAQTRVSALLDGGLTSDDAVQVGLLNNPRLQSLYYRIGVGRADVVQSQLLSNPSLGVSTRFPSGGGLVNLEAGLAQNLVDLWQLPLRKERAERALEQVILELAHEAASVAADIRTAYFRAVAAELLVEIAGLNGAAAQELLRLTEGLLAAGAVSRVDVDLSLSEVQATQLSIRAARLDAFERRLGLLRLLGLSGGLDVGLREALPDPPESAPTLEQVLEAAAQWRLDIAAARKELEALSSDLGLQRRRVFQVIEIGVEIEREARGRSNDGRFLGNALRSSLQARTPTLPPELWEEDADSEVTVGPSLTVELPLFDQNQAQIAKAELTFLAAARLVQAMLLDVTHDARVAHERAATAWGIAATYESEVLPLRERNLALAREAFRAGKIPLIPVIEAQRNLQTARADYVSALRDSALAWVEIERVVGRPRSFLEPEQEGGTSTAAEPD
jgi:cobalt-zinc-cadmium efflux system outer membrane protein